MGNEFESLISLIPSDGWQRVMVDAVWQSSLIGAFALIVSRWLVRQAAARAWLLMVALTACVVSPLISSGIRSGGWAVPISFGITKQIASEAPTSANVVQLASDRVLSDRNMPRNMTTTSEVPNSPNHSSRTRSGSLTASPQTSAKAPRRQAKQPSAELILPLVAVLWLSFSLLQLFRLVISAIAVQRMVTQSERCDDDVLLKSLSEASRRVGLATPPRLRVSDRISAPMILAYMRPTLLIPENTSELGGKDPEHFTTTFSHELAHIRRHDGWSKLWVQLVAALMPVQPLIWWMRKSFFEACEEACDDWAIEFGSEPVDLASALAAWSDGNPKQRELAFAAGMSGTRSRILRILAMKQPPTAKLSTRRRCCTAALASLCFAGLTFAQPQVASEEANPQRRTRSEPEMTAVQSPAIHQDAGAQFVNNQVANDEQFSTDAISIKGTCVDDQAKPILGARVRLFHIGYDTKDPSKMMQIELPSTRCDRNGAFTFNDVVRSGKFDSWVVIGQHPDRASVAKRIATEARGDQTFELTLLPAATLKGRVTDQEGRPVANATVTAGSSLFQVVPGIRTAMSDADGYYEISDLQAFSLANEKPHAIGDGFYESIGQCFGEIQHPDYARNRFPYSEIPGTANITLQRAAVVQGRVTLKGSDSAAIGARIEFWNDTIAADSWTRATADKQGNFRIDNLPPGDYRVNIRLDGRPNMAIPEVALSPGDNRKQFEMEQGGVAKGRVIDVETEQPIELSDRETMQISAVDQQGRWFAGMPTVNVQSNGSFTLRLPAGKSYLGMYLGPNWRGVNTDQLLKNGVNVMDGETTEFEIRVRKRKQEQPSIPKPLSNREANALAEQAAIAAIKQLGGWIVQEKIGGQQHVVEVNMVYHEDPRMGREENRLITDECLSYVGKFPKLKRLMLYREQATDAGLAKLRGLDRLEAIWIWDASAITDDGAAHLAHLESLTNIHLENSMITDKALKHFSGLPQIERLSLQGSHFTNRGLQYLQDVTQLKELVVGLGTNEITDEGIRFVSRLTNLERLGLQGSTLSDTGLQQLHSLKKLRELWVGNTKVTESGLEQLRQVLPELQ